MSISGVIGTLKRNSSFLLKKRRSWVFLVTILVSLVVQALILTHGTFDFSENEALGAVYTSMLDHLKRGEFDVSSDVIHGEAFIRDGKTYSYFGPAPVLLRGAIEVFVSRNGRDWARWSCFFASALTSVMV